MTTPGNGFLRWGPQVTAIFAGYSDQLNTTGRKPAIWPITACEHRSVTERRQVCLELHDCRVRQSRAVRELYCGYGLIPAIDAHHELRGRRIALDVHHPVPDPFAVELAAEPVAVATPGGRVHGQHRRSPGNAGSPAPCQRRTGLR